MFHRLTTPTYYGGLPSGADYLNTPTDPSVGGSGVPAYFDGKKTGGPNDGTYFFAFGENATSNFCNRGLHALGENTDELDNMLRRDLAITARTVDASSGAPVSSITLTGYVFVGAFGTANTQATRDALISILDSSDNEIITEYGVKVQALLVSDGTNNVVGTQTSGFYNGPTIGLNTPIPAGVTYRVYYGERSSLAALPMDAFTSIKIRGAQEVPAAIEQILKSLHTSTISANWNDPWVATINSLARGGLDARYRLSTYDNYSAPPLDTPGSGSSITRDGPAVTFPLPEYLMNQQGSTLLPYPDPFMACLRLEYPTTNVGVAYNKNLGGDVGIMQISPYVSTADANEHTSTEVAGSLLFAGVPRDVRASALGGNTAVTRVDVTTTAILNPDSGTTAVARSTIQLNATDYFRVAGGNSIRRHFDMLEVTEIATGNVLGVFRVYQFPADNRVELLAPTGAVPSIGVSGSFTPVRVRWIQTTVSIGGRHAAANGQYGVPHFVVAQPSYLTDGYDSNAFSVDAAFLSALGGYHRAVGATSFNGFAAMAWGGFDSTGAVSYAGYLQGDGGVYCLGGRQQLNLPGRTSAPYASGTGGRTCDWYLGASGNFVEIYTSGAAWTTSTTLTFAYHETAGFVAQSGDEFELLVHIPPGSTGPVQMAWSLPALFSGSDAIIPTSNTTLGTVTVRYRFVYSGVRSSWIATRTDI